MSVWVWVGFLWFLASVVGLIVWGRLRRHKEDEDTGGLLDGLPPWPAGTWPFTIIRLDPDPYQLNDAMQWAIDYWNAAVGVRLFVNLGDISPGETVPMIPITMEPPKAARVEFTHNNTTDNLSAHIQIDTDRVAAIPKNMQQRVMAHELGHLLQLEHDDIKRSIMYPKVGHDDQPVVTANDRELLNRTYAG